MTLSHSEKAFLLQRAETVVNQLEGVAMATVGGTFCFFQSEAAYHVPGGGGGGGIGAWEGI